MSLTALVCVGLDNAIGGENKLLWYLPEDLKNYKKLTSGGYLVVGRKTYDSLPEVAKKNRFHYVISSKSGINDITRKYFNTIDEFLEYQQTMYDSEIFVIGGQQIYEQLIRHCTKAIITTVCGFYPEADKFFPMHEISCGFNEISSTGKLKSKTGLEYVIREYVRTI